MHAIDDAGHGSLGKISDCLKPLSIVSAAAATGIGVFPDFSRHANAVERQNCNTIMLGFSRMSAGAAHFLLLFSCRASVQSSLARRFGGRPPFTAVFLCDAQIP
jgi:hypothetical protein